MNTKKILSFTLALFLVFASVFAVSAETPPYSESFENEDEMLSALSNYAEQYPDYEGFSFNSEISKGYHLEYRQVLSVDIDVKSSVPVHFSFAESHYGQGVDYTFTSFDYENSYPGVIRAFVYYGYNSDEVLARLDNAKAKEGVSTFDEGTVDEKPYVICKSFEDCDPPLIDYYLALNEYLIHIISFDPDVENLLSKVKVEYTDVYIPVKIRDSAEWFEKTIEKGYAMGDVNSDGVLNIRDATAVQKYVAKFGKVDKLMADFNGDLKINVKDATDIQKKLAGLKYTCRRELYPVLSTYIGTDDEHFIESVSYSVGPFPSGELSLITDYGDGDVRQYNTVLNSVEEFEAFFGITLDRFDEEYFEDQSLVYLYRWYGSSSEILKPDSLYFIDGVLNIHCIHNTPGDDGGWQAAIANYNVFFEVDKADIDGLKGIVVTEYNGTRG